MNSLGANGNGFDTGGRGPTDAIAYPNIYQLFGSGADASVQKIKSSLNSWAQSQAHNADRKSTRLNSSHSGESRMPSSA